MPGCQKVLVPRGTRASDASISARNQLRLRLTRAVGADQQAPAALWQVDGAVADEGLAARVRERQVIELHRVLRLPCGHLAAGRGSARGLPRPEELRRGRRRAAMRGRVFDIDCRAGDVVRGALAAWERGARSCGCGRLGCVRAGGWEGRAKRAGNGPTGSTRLALTVRAARSACLPGHAQCTPNRLHAEPCVPHNPSAVK